MTENTANTQKYTKQTGKGGKRREVR